MGQQKASDVTVESYLEVRANGEPYAIMMLDVHDVVRSQEITRIPSTRPFALGVIHLRGQIIPVVCLRERLGLTRGEATERSRIVVVHDHAGVGGLLVDSVHHVVSFEDIQIPMKNQRTTLKGIGRTQGSRMGILDLQRLLNG